MRREEKLLLLELILRDIRGNWGWDLEGRVEKASELAKELELDMFISRIEGFKKSCDDGYRDGRHFRTHHEYGGYEGMGELHGLPHTIIDRSDEFKSEIDILNYPENRFDDWDEYEEIDQ